MLMFKISLHKLRDLMSLLNKQLMFPLTRKNLPWLLLVNFSRLQLKRSKKMLLNSSLMSLPSGPDSLKKLLTFISFLLKNSSKKDPPSWERRLLLPLKNKLLLLVLLLLLNRRTVKKKLNYELDINELIKSDYWSVDELKLSSLFINI